MNTRRHWYYLQAFSWSQTPLLYLGPDFVLFLDVIAATESFVLCVGFKKSLRSNWYRGQRVILSQRVNNTFSKNLHIEVKDSLLGAVRKALE